MKQTPAKEKKCNFLPLWWKKQNCCDLTLHRVPLEGVLTLRSQQKGWKGTTTIALARANSTRKGDPKCTRTGSCSTSDNLGLVLYSNSTLPMTIFKSLYSVSHLNGKYTRDPLWYLKIGSSFKGSTLAHKVQPETTKSMKIHFKHKDKREALNSRVMHVGCQEHKAFNSFKCPKGMYAQDLWCTRAVPLH